MTQPNEIDKAIDNIADSIHDEIKGDILYRDLKEAVEMGYMLGFQQGCQDAIEKKVLAEKIEQNCYSYDGEKADGEPKMLRILLGYKENSWIPYEVLKELLATSEDAHG